MYDCSDFASLLTGEWEVPSKWKTPYVTVFFKKGDPKLPGNYRPITLLPILYKLFSRELPARVFPFFESAQCVDQAGFRSAFSCEDHLLSIVLLMEGSDEYTLSLWVCAIDFQKAFDTVDHSFLWQAFSINPCQVLMCFVSLKFMSVTWGESQGRQETTAFQLDERSDRKTR